MDCRHVYMEINQWTADMFIWKLTDADERL